MRSYMLMRALNPKDIIEVASRIIYYWLDVVNLSYMFTRAFKLLRFESIPIHSVHYFIIF